MFHEIFGKYYNWNVGRRTHIPRPPELDPDSYMTPILKYVLIFLTGHLLLLIALACDWGIDIAPYNNNCNVPFNVTGYTTVTVNCKGGGDCQIPYLVGETHGTLRTIRVEINTWYTMVESFEDCIAEIELAYPRYQVVSVCTTTDGDKGLIYGYGFWSDFQWTKKEKSWNVYYMLAFFYGIGLLTGILYCCRCLCKRNSHQVVNSITDVELVPSDTSEEII